MVDDQETAPTRAYVETLHQEIALLRGQLQGIPPVVDVAGWKKVPEEPTLEFLKSINRDNQVLAYENGRYYNAWFEFEQSEGGWLWTDDTDSEPNPSHYRVLPEGPAATEADQ